MPSQLAPGFLVAAPSLLDPNFKSSVVLLIDHRKEGSLGFIVNRPANVSFKGVADELGLGSPGAQLPDIPVLVDGNEQGCWTSFAVKKGQTLSFGYLKSGARLYIAVAGGIDVPPALLARADDMIE